MSAVDAVADDFDTWEGVCGKDGQAAPVGSGSPTLRISRLTVGGHGCLTSTSSARPRSRRPTGDEAVEAYAEESRHTEASALRGEIEGLTFAESRGVGVRPDRRRPARLRVRCRPDARRGARGGARARGRTRRSPSPTSSTCCRSGEPASPLPELYREEPSEHPDRSEGRAGARRGARAPSAIDPRVVEGRCRPRSATRCRASRSRPRAACRPSTRGPTLGVAVALAVEADETQTRILVHDRPRARRPGLGGGRRRGGASARCGMLGAAKPPTANGSRSSWTSSPAMSFLGVLAGALSAEAVLKGALVVRVAGRAAVGSELFTLVDDGRSSTGRRASRSTTRACPPGAPSCSRVAC